MKERKEDSKNSLERLVKDVVCHMEETGYTRRCVLAYARTMRRFQKYSEEKGVRHYSKELAEQYITKMGIPCDVKISSLKTSQQKVRTAMRYLEEFDAWGYWRQRPSGSYARSLSGPLSEPAKEYLRIRRKTLRHVSMYNEREYLTLFLHYLYSKNIEKWKEFRPDLVSEFLFARPDYSPRTRKTLACICGRFLRHLWIQGIVDRDYSTYVPHIYIPKDSRLPVVWNPEDINRLLLAVDRSSPMGKRDYAILLFACRLGMRGCDIRALRLDHINWKESKIVCPQTKTGRILSLPLTEEIGEALIDYLRNGRPVTAHREVFLRALAPYEPFVKAAAFHNIITTYRRRAGIPLPPKGHGGLHSLRHTLACQLMESDVPFETISDILGHSSLDSTRIYAKVNVDELRSAALDPEEVPYA